MQLLRIFQPASARFDVPADAQQAICSAHRAQAGLSVPYVDSCSDSFCSGIRIADAGRDRHPTQKGDRNLK